MTAQAQPLSREAYKPEPYSDKYASGIQLIKDTQVGVIAIKFPPDTIDQVGQEFYDAQIKPLLEERHQLRDGPPTWFRENEQGNVRTLRFSFVKRDENGEAIKRADGKNEHMAYYHEANILAHRIAAEVDKRLSAKLGIERSQGAEVPF